MDNPKNLDKLEIELLKDLGLYEESKSKIKKVETYIDLDAINEDEINLDDAFENQDEVIEQESKILKEDRKINQEIIQEIIQETEVKNLNKSNECTIEVEKAEEDEMPIPRFYYSDDDYYEADDLLNEDDGEEFQPIDIPLHSKDLWDDRALIAAWDEGVRQRDLKESQGKVYKRKLNRIERKETRASESNNEVEMQEGIIKAKESVHKRANVEKANTFAKRAEPNETDYIQEEKEKDKDKDKDNNLDTNPLPTSQLPHSNNIPIIPPISMPTLRNENGSNITHDQDLQNLLSAWYFAGYYSALYQERYSK